MVFSLPIARRGPLLGGLTPRTRSHHDYSVEAVCRSNRGATVRLRALTLKG
jgi:hypothetical protein